MSMTISPIATHPLAIVLFLVSHCAIMLGSTSPDSLLRLATFPLQPLVTLLLSQTDAMAHWGTATKTSISSFVFFMPLQYLDLALLSGWSFAAKGPTMFWNSDKRGTVIANATAKGHPVSEDVARSHILFHPASFIAELLRLPSRDIARRYSEVVFAFLISGVPHRLIDTTLGVPWSESGAFRFFAMQPVGILIEDGV
jgi:hypothetical protein